MKHSKIFILIYVFHLFILNELVIADPNFESNLESSGGLIFNGNELNDIPSWNSARTRSLAPSATVKDLRYNQNGEKLFPEIGKQGMNDCTAWASAYHLKTYLEAVDNQWIPDRPSRIFSPSFIYNQINGGRDSGSHLADALKLMNQTGAATLSTMPYTMNYVAKPNQSAYSEAKKFKINKYYYVNTISNMKQALQQGNPLLVGIVTDATFNSGRYSIYNKAMRDSARDRLGTSHGRHAMVIVGYDDIRKAFLFLNSWGSSWGDKGYVWIGYDVFDTIGYSQTGDNFLEVALVAIDDKGKLENIDSDKNDIRLNGTTWFIGIDDDGNNQWGWKGTVSGSQKWISQITKVNWNVPEEISSNEEVSEKINISGTSNSKGKKDLQSIITFQDGSTKLLSLSLEFKDIRRGALKFVQTDKYYGKINSQNYWDWSIKVDGSLTDLNDIKKVVYHLHPSFKNPNIEVASSPENGFVYTTRGWGTFDVGASVYFKNGTKEEFKLKLKFNDLIKPNLVLKNTSLPLEMKNGKTLYNWTAFIEGSELALSKIKKVEYTLHPTFKNNLIDVTEGRDVGFPFSATGWGTFEIKAVVFFEDGNRQELKHMLVFKN